MNSIRKCIENIDRKKAFEMILGIVGINISFLVIGILYEKLTNQQYYNTITGKMDDFRSGAGFVLIERGTNWLYSEVYKCFFIPKEKRVKIPWKLSAVAATTIYISVVAQTEAMFLVSYPFIIMTKSCSLISVILVGVLCSRVRSK